MKLVTVLRWHGWRSKPQNWIHSMLLDSILLLLPAFLSTGLAVVYRSKFDLTEGLTLGAWVILILCVDVAHVYASLFRTYLNPGEWKQNRILFLLVPCFCWGIGTLLYAVDSMLFWRALAYLAVFHFVRQQYGFLKMYSGSEENLDQALIYIATLYPLIYWHTHLPRNYHWFVEGDFLEGLPVFVDYVGKAVYIIIAVFYLVKEVRVVIRDRFLNVPKQMILLGTMMSWYCGIVLFNGDLIFTLTNVVSHGIPYIALVWIVGRKTRSSPTQQRIFSLGFVPIYLGILLGLAYLEEGLWDGFVWRDHLEIFGLFRNLPLVRNPMTLAWLVPLLALPQSTHYVLDGFIWKLKSRGSALGHLLNSAEVKTHG